MWSELAWLMWSDFIFKLSEVKWVTAGILFLSEVKWSEMSYGEVLGDKSTVYFRVTLYWVYLFILWLFHLGISCTVVVSTCTVVVFTCFVICGCEYVWVFVMCGCFGNMYTCIYCVLYCLCCVFSILSFMYIYSFFYLCKDYCHRMTTQLQLVIIIIIIIIIIKGPYSCHILINIKTIRKIFEQS